MWKGKVSLRPSSQDVCIPGYWRFRGVHIRTGLNTGTRRQYVSRTEHNGDFAATLGGDLRLFFLHPCVVPRTNIRFRGCEQVAQHWQAQLTSRKFIYMDPNATLPSFSRLVGVITDNGNVKPVWVPWNNLQVIHRHWAVGLCKPFFFWPFPLFPAVHSTVIVMFILAPSWW